MAYGINAPFGLQPRQYLNGSIWSGQLDQALIASAYATSLFTGDPVAFLSDGTIGIAPEGTPVLGVFFGCYYTSNSGPQGTQVYAPYWAAGTVTFQSAPATALIIMDRNVLYSIQASNSAPLANTATQVIQNQQLGVAQLNIGQNAAYAIGGSVTTIAATYPNGTAVIDNPTSGNVISAQSGYYLDCNTLPASTPFTTPVTSRTVVGDSTNLALKIIRLEPSVNPANVFWTGPSAVLSPTVAPVGSFNNVIVSLNNDVFNGPTTRSGIQSAIASGTLTAADINNVFQATTAVIELVRGIPGYTILMNTMTLSVISGGVATTGGGSLFLQYGATVAGSTGVGGTSATGAAINTATGQAAGVETVFNAAAGSAITAALATTVSGLGIYLNCGTGAFVSGNEIVNYSFTYSIVPA